MIEAFGREERTPSDVAAATGTHTGTLARVIRALESRILETCRRAMTPASRLVLFEFALPAGAEPNLGKIIDLHMLVLFGASDARACLDRIPTRDVANPGGS